MAGLKDLNNLPKTTNANLWCDFIELHCLVNENRSVTPNDIFNIISDDEIGEDKLEDVMDSIDEEEFSLDFLINFGIEETDDIEDTIGNNVSKTKDDIVKKIDDYFLNLAYRSDIFGDDYPFEIDLDNSKISLKRIQSINQSLYGILLISSNLNYSLEYMPFLTAQFEYFSIEVLRSLLPNNSTIHIYGKNNSGIETPFVGKEINKLQLLSKELNISLTPNSTDKFISKFSTGDTGLDIVGWYNFEDNMASSIKYFAQCACGKEWIDKQFDVSMIKWSNFLNFLNDPIPMIIIPRSFRDENGEWENPLKIYNTVLIDRLRLLKAIPMKTN